MAGMKELIEDIAKALVDEPEQVAVRETVGEQITVLELRVAAGDLGKVIGKQGRTARSIRTLLGAAGMKLNRRFTLEGMLGDSRHGYFGHSEVQGLWPVGGGK